MATLCEHDVICWICPTSSNKDKKRRYLDLIEQNKLDNSTVADRMQEIRTDLIKFRAEKSRLELELTEDNSSPVVFEQVHQLIHGFYQLLTAAPFEQNIASLVYQANHAGYKQEDRGD